MAPKVSPASIEDDTLSVMKRTAIDTSGCIGSFYDAYQDQVLGKLKVKIKTQMHTDVRCEVLKGNTDGIQNLLEMIGIQDDLRLSILFNLVSKTGIASLIDYPHPLNEYTRLLCFRYVDREEKLSDVAKKEKKRIKSIMSQTNVTHIITAVRFGIDFVAVLQLPSEAEPSKTIDIVLKNIETTFFEGHHAKKLTAHDLDELKKITLMKFYSNIPNLARMTSLNDIYENIHQFKMNTLGHRPIVYDLRTIQEIYHKSTEHDNTVVPFNASFNNKVEEHFLQLSTSIKSLEVRFTENMPSLLGEHLQGLFYDMYMRWLDVKKKYAGEIERFSKLVIDFRRGKIQMSQIDNAFNDVEYNKLKSSIDDLNRTLKDLKAKEKLITDLQQQKFQYWNVAKRNLDEFDNEEKVETTLINDAQFDRILCSNDTLNTKKTLLFKNLRDILVTEHSKNTSLRLIYADFSYCTYPLRDIIILPIREITDNENTNQQSTSPQSTESETYTKPSSSSNDDIINILLLGESGVGKSTFINAFVNYLTFKTLSEAQKSKPVVLIPVSFMMTTGDNFAERIIKFGDVDSLDNEDFNHPGQSVTQQCKSYVFRLNHLDGRKLRIIDTPGFGDTRGLGQDDLNLQHILEYISNFTHLNAICFLLKPNVSRLNISFRTCFTELLNFLGHNARKSIIFCFTNARSTFYGPGDTAPLIRTMLDSPPKLDIPFKKENTFCFDSESFRYLVALQNLFKFEDKDKQEYEKSWSTSATQSNRLIDYIRGNVAAYRIENERKSIKHAQLQIVHMIRPMLEAMRNTLRNIVLIKTGVKNTSIKLQPKAIQRPVTLCLSTERPGIEVASLWILSDWSHQSMNESDDCPCALSQHIPVNYTLAYKISNSPVSHHPNELFDQLSLLLNASAEFAHFLKYSSLSSKDDPFLAGLKHMIQEEKQICADKRPKMLNETLLEELEKLISKYERRMNGMKSNGNDIELPVIYERIKIVCSYPEVHEQMVVIKIGQENIMKHYEYEVPNDFMNTSDCVTATF